MFCEDCPCREDCSEICPLLEASLQEEEGYQRELLLSPDKLALVANRVRFSHADLLVDASWVWEEVRQEIGILPPFLFLPFYLHFYQGLSPEQVAEELRLHRSTVSRRLAQALALLREKFNPSPAEESTEEMKTSEEIVLPSEEEIEEEEATEGSAFPASPWARE